MHYQSSEPGLGGGRGTIAALVAMLSLGACTGEQLPNGATLSLSPAESGIRVIERLDEQGRCRIDPGRYIDEPFVVALRDGQGSPIGDAEVVLHASFTENVFPGYPVIALYIDRNGNGVIDAETELASGGDDGLVRVRTSRYGGEYMLLMRKNISCAWQGSLQAFAGNAFVSVPIEVTADADGDDFGGNDAGNGAGS